MPDAGTPHDAAGRVAADRGVARRRLAQRRDTVESRLASVEGRLADVRVSRADWTDEEHDPEGFSLTFEWQQAEGLRAAAHTELAELDAADARLSAGSYGVCAACGRPIPDAQLELRPARTTCVACAGRR